MLEISYHNVMNGLNKGIHMNLLVPTRQVGVYLFHRACDLWHIKGFSEANKGNLSIVYGIDRIQIQFKVFESLHSSSWRGFRGVFMLHPDITPETTMPKFQQMIDEMDWHNERHMKSWQP